jgi:hypothetical protein
MTVLSSRRESVGGLQLARERNTLEILARASANNTDIVSGPPGVARRLDDYRIRPWAFGSSYVDPSTPRQRLPVVTIRHRHDRPARYLICTLIHYRYLDTRHADADTVTRGHE